MPSSLALEHQPRLKIWAPFLEKVGGGVSCHLLPQLPVTVASTWHLLVCNCLGERGPHCEMQIYVSKKGTGGFWQQEQIQSERQAELREEDCRLCLGLDQERSWISVCYLPVGSQRAKGNQEGKLFLGSLTKGLRLLETRRLLSWLQNGKVSNSKISKELKSWHEIVRERHLCCSLLHHHHHHPPAIWSLNQGVHQSVPLINKPLGDVR